MGYAQAAVTILFRPLPIEAHGTESMATALEGLFLLGLVLVSWRRLLSIPRRIRPEPYVALAVSFVLMFIFAFGTIANFGILARERSQMMPFLFILLSLTAITRTARPQPAFRPLTRRPSARRPAR